MAEETSDQQDTMTCTHTRTSGENRRIPFSLTLGPDIPSVSLRKIADVTVMFSEEVFVTECQVDWIKTRPNLKLMRISAPEPHMRKVQSTGLVSRPLPAAMAGRGALR